MLHDKTAQSHIRNSLEELQCSKNIEKSAATTQVVENLVCSSSIYTNSVNENFEQDDYSDRDDNEDSNGNVYLMSIPVRDLPCPLEYRPTPITVKQGSPPGTDVIYSGSNHKKSFVVLIISFLFLV